ncbi:MAG TPA: hypothetical protein VNF73_03500, partial [Candidatus Saccharimonadales bacterium]|nr:hypothetical protein [Candidatus Saccharimonadales bacterium]
FVLALAWDRLGTAGRGRLRGREIQLGPVRRHTSVLASSLLFIALGLAFVAFQGGNALGAAYDAFGAADLSLRIESAVRDLASRAPVTLVAIVVLPMAILLAIFVRAHRSDRLPEETP